MWTRTPQAKPTPPPPHQPTPTHLNPASPKSASVNEVEPARKRSAENRRNPDPPYSERINGRIAILGLTALVLVELATGKSLISYHTLAIIFIEIYFVAAAAALYVKYEKEKVSVWPPSQS
ncbi:hypothetical protein F3Y22_tig00110020pilonHSYRG00393 [Hibiscus syriacus]|uniref:Uncharacterized protein n=1 Tax=Hibiscus syriacus TaxID=106335 RepID=A0A6A3BSL4_HIBSY|nr:hypothetical protein F3Y22_tig00110020pilonHSYRG00393 [Hibiscus syriacus]